MNGDGKSNPFGNGKSGATGNSGGGSCKGLDSKQRGPDIPQKSGLAADINADSISEGGRILKLDPPSDRQGLVGQTAKGMKHKPFKLGGGSGPAKNADVSDGGPVGDVPNEDSPSDEGRD